MSKLNLVPTLTSKINEDSAWCVSFDLAWKELVTNVLNNDFKCLNPNQLVDDLTEECKNNFGIQDNDYYVKSGPQTIKLKKEIVKVIKKKFKTKSDVLDSIEFSKDKNTLEILVYAIVMFALEFPKRFDIYDEKAPFRNSQQLVNYFGIMDADNKELLKQVRPLFYLNDNDFALSLKSKDFKRIILYRTDSQDDFKSVYSMLHENLLNNKDNIIVNSVAIPNLKLNISNRFEELAGKSFVRNSDNMKFSIAQALQTLKFELNNAGAKVKSEAIIGLEKTGIYNPNAPKIRDFVFNNTFYLFIVEDNAPIVALRVYNIENYL